MSKESCYNTSTCSPFLSPLLQHRPYLASYDTSLHKRKIGIVLTPLFSGSFQIMIDNPHLARVGSESRDVKEKYLQMLSSLEVIIFSFHQAGNYTQIFINRFLMQKLSANLPYYRANCSLCQGSMFWIFFLPALLVTLCENFKWVSIFI